MVVMYVEMSYTTGITRTKSIAMVQVVVKIIIAICVR